MKKKLFCIVSSITLLVCGCGQQGSNQLSDNSHEENVISETMKTVDKESEIENFSENVIVLDTVIDTSEEVTDWEVAYQEWIFQKNEENPNLEYAMFYFDEDDIPELLVTSADPEDLSPTLMYTYVDQEVISCGELDYGENCIGSCMIERENFYIAYFFLKGPMEYEYVCYSLDDDKQVKWTHEYTKKCLSDDTYEYSMSTPDPYEMTEITEEEYKRYTENYDKMCDPMSTDHPYPAFKPADEVCVY